MSEKTKTLWVGVNSYGLTAAGPEYARIELTEKRVERLLVIGAVAAGMDLTEARIAGSPASWGPGSEDDDDELRLISHEVVVVGNGFWFTARPKHEDGSVETESIDLETLRDLWGRDDKHVFISGYEDIDDFIALIRDCGDTNLPTTGESLFAYHRSVSATPPAESGMGGSATNATTEAVPAVPFVGEDHPRYNEWRTAVESDSTLLGLADWLDHNPPDEDEDE